MVYGLCFLDVNVFAIECINRRTRIEYYANKFSTHTHKAIGSHRSRFMLFRCQRFCNRVYIQLVIVFTRAAPAFEDLFNTCIWFLLDINTVHKNVKKEKFGIFIEVNICVTG